MSPQGDEPQNSAAVGASLDASRLEVVPCNLCGSGAFRVIYDLPPYKIVECRQCRLVYTSPRATLPAILGELYDADYWSQYENVYEGDLEGVRQFARRWLGNIAPYVDGRPWRICELGPGLGVFLSEAKNAGHSVWGVDPSRYAIQSAKDRFGIDTIVEGTLLDIDPDSIPELDVFVMLASIEHLQDPIGALRFARAHLRPGGILLLSTGVWGSFNQRIAGTAWGIILPKDHLYYFSKQSIRAALEKAGFEVVRFDTNSFLVNVLTAKRFLVRVFNNPVINHLRVPLLVERFRLGDEMFILAKAK